MFFNKQTRQAFIFPTKVGTMTARHFLGSVGWHGKMEHHATLDELLVQYPALSDYTVFGFFRDPVLRFESAILHIKQFKTFHSHFASLLSANGINKSIEDVSYEDVATIEGLGDKHYPLLFKPQAFWLGDPKVTVLDFNNFESELRRITGNIDAPMKRWNTSSDFGRKEITQAVIDFVKVKYVDDHNLAARNNI
jgi:hypothetical protein